MTTAALDELLAELCLLYRVPGAQAAVLFDGRVVSATYGTFGLDSTQAVTATTKFRIGCVSKLITTCIALSLARTGLVSLDATLASSCAAFPVPRGADGVTLRHLLAHSSGIDPSVALAFYQSKEGLTPRQFVTAALGSANVIAQPGSVFAYSMLDFSLAGCLLEISGGSRWLQLAVEHVFKPLNISPLFFEEASAAVGRVPASHYLSGVAPYVRASDPPPIRSFLLPAGSMGMYATALEVLAIGELMLNWQRADVGAQRHELFTKMLAIPGHPFMEAMGLGLMRFSNGAWGHIGNSEGHHAFVNISKDDGTIVVLLANAYSCIPLFWEFTGHFIRSTVTHGDYDGTADADRTQYEGRYECNAAAIDVAMTPDGAEIRVVRQPPAAGPESTSRFILRDIDQDRLMFVVASPPDPLFRGPVHFFTVPNEGRFCRVNLLTLKWVSAVARPESLYVSVRSGRGPHSH